MILQNLPTGNDKALPGKLREGKLPSPPDMVRRQFSRSCHEGLRLPDSPSALPFKHICPGTSSRGPQLRPFSPLGPSTILSPSPFPYPRPWVKQRQGLLIHILGNEMMSSICLIPLTATHCHSRGNGARRTLHLSFASSAYC